MSSVISNRNDFNKLIDNIRSLIIEGRKNIVKKVNHELIHTYWKIG